MESNKIYCGDALEVLKTFPEESINCCMTSPPYWALRDYGTAKWEGGIAECDHQIPDYEKDPKNPNAGSHIFRFNKEICFKCGAKRVDLQLGLEPTFDLYIKHLCDIFDEVKRVLRKDGTLWVNIGDTYSATRWSNSAGTSFMAKNNENNTYGEIFEKKTDLQDKSLCNIPARFSIEMQNRGWILRNVIIWHKPNCMPSSVKDRFTVDFEYLYFFVKNKKYWFETIYEPQKQSSIIRVYATNHIENRKGEEPYAINHISQDKFHKRCVESLERGETLMRNKRAVWTITTKPFKEAHFATYPESLCETPIKAGCPIGGLVLDPFFGAGTTGLVALKQNKKFIGIELNPKYIEIAERRLKPYLEQEKLK